MQALVIVRRGVLRHGDHVEDAVRPGAAVDDRRCGDARFPGSPVRSRECRSGSPPQRAARRATERSRYRRRMRRPNRARWRRTPRCASIRTPRVATRTAAGHRPCRPPADCAADRNSKAVTLPGVSVDSERFWPLRLRSFLYVSTSIPGGWRRSRRAAAALRLVVRPSASVTTTAKMLPSSPSEVVRRRIARGGGAGDRRCVPLPLITEWRSPRCGHIEGGGLARQTRFDPRVGW